MGPAKYHGPEAWSYHTEQINHTGPLRGRGPGAAMAGGRTPGPGPSALFLLSV